MGNPVTAWPVITGRVEVYYSQEWGTVCDDDFGIDDCNVACRQLGQGQCVAYDTESYPQGSSSVRIWLDDLRCQGHEATLDSCGHSGWGQHNCGHHEDVMVSCTCSTADCDAAPSPPGPPPGSVDYFSVSGDCELSRGGDCVVAELELDGDYGNNQDCTITVNTPTVLSVLSYSVESSHDYLTVEGQRYQLSSYPNGPDGVAVSSGDTITWRSDGSVTNCGWEFCASPQMTGTNYAQAACPSYDAGLDVGFMVYWFRANWWYLVVPIIFAGISIAAIFKQRQLRQQALRHRAQRIQSTVAPPPPQPVAQAVPLAPQPQPVMHAMPTGVATGGGGSVADQLASLGQLRAQGVLDVNQFEAAKAQVLSGGGMGGGYGAPMVGAMPMGMMGGEQMAMPVGPVVQAYAMPVPPHQQHL